MVSETQTDRVVLELREMLLRGEFSPGERLTELGLVARIAASRTPVRHALGQLASEGLLDAMPAGGFCVRSFTLQEIWDAIELRGVLEGVAARLAAERLESPDELARLAQYTQAMGARLPVSAHTFAEYLELNRAFHAELRRLSKSRMVLEVLGSVLRLPFADPGALVFGPADTAPQDGLTQRSHEQHLGLVKAIGDRDGARAEALAREHAQLARRNLEHALDVRELFHRVPGAALVRLPDRV